ncbi:MAG: hypothetical protein ACO3A8_05690 [Steroidobacteraceae bacterium]|jgi:hypothetical protein|nr:DUF2802 domain-containing protein [Gammaproteobacteria bacterium]
MLEILNEPSVRTFAPFALAALGAVVGVASVRIVAWLRRPRPFDAAQASRVTARDDDLPAKLARSGADRAQLMMQCGLDADEAALVLRLHGSGPTRD